jgi:hypothetical protein
MTLASQKAGVDTLVPIDPTALSAKYYQPDELHLNSEGARLFTSALATFQRRPDGDLHGGGNGLANTHRAMAGEHGWRREL